MTKAKTKAGEQVLVCRIERCMACRSCELACAVAHSGAADVLEAVRQEPRPQSRVRVESAGGRAVALQCRHCEDAPCVAVCPTEAVHRAGERGPVLIDADRCIACKMCLMVCPFGAIEMARDGRAVVKCDLCAERASRGEAPACVSACPTRALVLATAGDLSRRKRRAAAQRLVEEAEAARE